MHRKVGLDTSFSAAQQNGIIISLILSGSCTFVELLVGSKQLLVDFAEVELLGLTVVHEHHVV